MAVATRVTAGELGRSFATAVRDEAPVSGLWASTEHGDVHLWLLVEAIDADTEDRLYELADLLYNRFPEADFQLHILNPGRYTGDARDALPSGAEEIELRAAER